MKFAKYYEIMRIDMIEKATYIWNQLVWGFIIGAVLFIFVHVWTAIYAGKATIEGYTLPQMIWYLGFAETLMFAQGTNFIKIIGDEVRTGLVATTLLKPLSYIGKNAALMMSNALFKFAAIGVMGLAVANGLVGMIDIDLLMMPLVFIAAFLSFIISILLVHVIAITAFWLEDSSSLYFIYQKLLFILGGMLVPLDVYPVWLQGYLQYLPTAFLLYYPAKLFVKFNMDLFWLTIVGQLCYVIVFAILLFIIYKIGVRKVNINGG